MTEATDYLASVRAQLEQRDPNQPEFLEAIDNFFKTIAPVLENIRNT
ncbi:hypothetical protein [Secundilactobacillus paracollinoides]